MRVNEYYEKLLIEAYYYYNERTKESGWEEPELWTKQMELENKEKLMKEQSKIHTLSSKDKMDNSNKNIDDSMPQTLNSSADINGKDGSDISNPNENTEDLENTKTMNEEKEKLVLPPVTFSEEELRLLRQRFDEYDKDHSGSISGSELQKGLYTFGINVSYEQAENLIKTVDKDGSGEVDFNEFVTILTQTRDTDNTVPLQLIAFFGVDEINNLQKQFAKFDIDGSGEIDEVEIKKVMHMLGQNASSSDVKKIIQEVDKNGNGKIDFSEFVQIVYKMRNTNNQSGFGKILQMGLLNGLFGDLAVALNSTKKLFVNWLNSEEIATEAARQQQLEKIRLRKQALQLQQEEANKIYQEKKQQDLEELRRRWKSVPGFKHEVEFEGDNETYPNKGQFVRVHYTGMFMDGSEFESSRRRGGAFEFQIGVGVVIQGWDIGVLQMSIGETALLTCSPSLAYGIKGLPPVIPPNTTLLFRIELISILERAYKEYMQLEAGENDNY